MSIDSCYEGVIAKLTSQQKIIGISAELLSLKTDNERVLYVYKILEDLNAFPSVKEVKKSNEQSLYYRNLGNKCFQQSEFHKAWQYYNLSLLNATLNSECYCIALSNRSAVFFELEKYNECIQDIDRVFSLQYPNKLTEKLNKRKESCVEILDMVKDTPSRDNIKVEKILEMKSPKDPVYVAASNKLKVVYSEEMGRHVVAKEDISVGEVIVKEDPYFTILIKSQYLVACNYCMSRNLNLMPCDNCCFSLYCSNECKEKAWKQYHEIECPLNATLLEMDFTKLELLALRTVIKARTDHSSWDELFNTIEAADSLMNTDFHGQVKVDDKWIYDSKYYASIHSLATNKERRSISDIFQKAVTAVVFLRFLKCNTNFLQSDYEDEKEKILQCVARLLMIHEMTTPTNMHAISSNVGDQNGNFVEEINLGSAPYAFCSLINHSCAPNVVRYSKLGSGRMSVIALRPIKKGMQIFDNYGSHHAVEGRNTRQKSLNFQYKFTCNCEACVNNWPTYMQLQTRMINKVPNRIVQKVSNLKERLLSMDVINQLQSGDLETALKIYDSLCHLCETFEKYAPCSELCECQEALKQCLVIFEGVVPYGCDLMVDHKFLSTESNSSCTIA